MTDTQAMTFPIPQEVRSTKDHDDVKDIPQLHQRRSIPSTILEEGSRDSVKEQRRERLARRASSFRTDSSSGATRRASFRSSTESLISPPRPPSRHEELHEEPSLWYSAPLLFAIVPAIGGVAFKKGAIVFTDIALLSLAAVYLNWCLVTPWIWYHSAQSVQLAKEPLHGPISEEALQEDLNGNEAKSNNAVPNAGDFPDTEQEVKPGVGTEHSATAGKKDQVSAREASAELQLHELAALAMCILGPLLGAYILHLVRSSLSSLHGGQLVSDLHLTLFVLGAELRPIRHCTKLVQARTLHLQRVVRSDPHPVSEGGTDSEEIEDLMGRVDELEASVAQSKVAKNEAQAAAGAAPVASPDDVKRSQQALQSQIDALNRAVRRYEKRMTAQSMQAEARMQDLEARLKDALSLAAAAANYSQKRGLVGSMLDWAIGIINSVLDMLLYPLRLLSEAGWSMLKKLGLARPLRRKKPPERQRKIDKAKSARDSNVVRSTKVT